MQILLFLGVLSRKLPGLGPLPLRLVISNRRRRVNPADLSCVALVPLRGLENNRVAAIRLG